jgi:hypothetical protein
MTARLSRPGSVAAIAIAACAMAVLAPASRALAQEDETGGDGLAQAAFAAQPAWSSPLVTTTGLLEQRFRFDVADQRAGNGTRSLVVDDSRGLDLIIGPATEIQMALPPYTIRHAPGAAGTKSGFADGSVFRLEERLASSPAGAGDYVVTAWLQVQAPAGIAAFTNKAWMLQPTLAMGKGWGDFDVQATVAGVFPTSNQHTLGEQAQTNIALQYHLMQIFWPELEWSWTYFGGGPRNGLNQLYLTPGLVVGRFNLGSGLRFTTGAGYQTAIAPRYRAQPLTPGYDHAWLFSTRLNF